MLRRARGRPRPDDYGGRLTRVRGCDRRQPEPAGPVAVCDVGGGSTQITIGDRTHGVAWTASRDVGSSRLTAATLVGDPPTAAEAHRRRALHGEFHRSQPSPYGEHHPRRRGGARRRSCQARRSAADRAGLERALRLIVALSDELARENGPQPLARIRWPEA